MRVLQCLFWRNFLIWYLYFSSSCNLLQKDHNDALKELQLQLSNGISLKDLQSSHMTDSTKPVFKNKEQIRYGVPSYPCRRHDVEKWLQKNYKGHVKTTTLPSSSFVALVENSLGADNVISRQSYHMGHEIVVSIIVIGNFCLHRRNQSCRIAFYAFQSDILLPFLLRTVLVYY